MRAKDKNGYSLVELLVVIIIVGVIASVAIDGLGRVTETSRYEETMQELDQLAEAVAGDAHLITGGSRVDYGYIGDVGSLPLSLDNLVNRPGGYVTWDGPYIHDDYYSVSGGAESEYGFDAWGDNYTFGTSYIRSTGSGNNITRRLANSADDLLNNEVDVLLLNLDHYPPGPTYHDSVTVTVHFPRGGAMTSSTVNPRADGLATVDSIPIGLHLVEVAWLPTADTVRYRIGVNPGKRSYLEIQLNGGVW